MNAKLSEKVDNVKLSHLEVVIFEQYCRTEILPLKDLLKRKFHRLQKLRKQNPNDLTREEAYLENEVHTLFQAVTALDGLKQVYSKHYFQLWEEKQRLEYKLACTKNDLHRARELATQAIEGEALYLGLLTKKTA